jgi:hypothetical protein
MSAELPQYGPGSLAGETTSYLEGIPPERSRIFLTAGYCKSDGLLSTMRKDKKRAVGVG